MHPHFLSLPQPLLHHLGGWQTPTSLAQALVHAAQLPAPDHNAQGLVQHLRQNTASQTCLSLDGLDVLLHRAPDASGRDAAEPAWGLHSLCWHTGAVSETPWRGAWPEGIDPQTVRPAQLVQRLAREPEEALSAPGMVCFEVDGHDGRRWALLGLFDASGQRLHSLHLSRVGDWVPLSPASASALSTPVAA